MVLPEVGGASPATSYRQSKHRAPGPDGPCGLAPHAAQRL